MAKGGFGVKGGSGHMFGKSGAPTQTPGHTSRPQTGVGPKFPSGGSGHMFGKTGATPVEPGVTNKRKYCGALTRISLIHIGLA
jgi:hypothetical protein